MRKIAWRASLMRGWFRLFSFHGQIEVHSAASESYILHKVRKAILKSLKIEWKEL